MSKPSSRPRPLLSSEKPLHRDALDSEHRPTAHATSAQREKAATEASREFNRSGTGRSRSKTADDSDEPSQ